MFKRHDWLSFMGGMDCQAHWWLVQNKKLQMLFTAQETEEEAEDDIDRCVQVVKSFIEETFPIQAYNCWRNLKRWNKISKIIYEEKWD